MSNIITKLFRLFKPKDSHRFSDNAVNTSSSNSSQQSFLKTLPFVILLFLAVAFAFWTLQQQKKTQASLNTALQENENKEKIELRLLLRDATQITRGGNCPPIKMRQLIDSLYQKRIYEDVIQQSYTTTMQDLEHCDI